MSDVSAEPALVARGLTKVYRDGTTGIEDLDLTVARGETAGFVGPNGSGKSTTIRLVLDLLRPTRGEARVFGLDSRRESMAVRRRVGFLPGDLAFHGSLRGDETLEFYARLRRERGAPRRRELVERLGLSARDLRRRVRTYSTGMRRKLGLIVAMQHDPELAILDEPTTGLDPLVRRACHDAIRAWRDGGRTLFLSSHDVLEVDALCDRVLIVREGQLAAERTIEQLRTEAGGARSLEDALLSYYATS
jgi:ABC-2 type transport system ATP-binding protein